MRCVAIPMSRAIMIPIKKLKKCLKELVLNRVGYQKNGKPQVGKVNTKWQRIIALMQG